MIKEKNVVDFYILCNNLKKTIRTGWKDWNVKAERLESVAEHIYGVQILAIAMKSEYNYDIDIMKVIYMLAIHELGETIIGDLTQFQISKEEKQLREHEAVHKILENLIDKNQIEQIYLEFEEQKTKEAIFAYLCDKLECDIQCKLYDLENYVDLNQQENNKTANNDLVQKLLNENKTWSDMWLEFGQLKYPYDENFTKVSNYVKKYKKNEK